MEKGTLAVVLVSGGMDSCVTAAIANLSHELAFLHAKYRQKTEQRELRAFNDIADYYNVKRRLIIDLKHLSIIGGSCLTDPSIEIPEARLDSGEIPISYVPFRNANIISAAVSWAEVIGARFIYIGAMEEDSSGYPDCRRRFYEAFNKLIYVGTKPETEIEIVTPIIGLKKSQVVKRGVELNAPFQLSWSCYKNKMKGCGECESCVLRYRGFIEAGVKDPLPYEKIPQF